MRRLSGGAPRQTLPAPSVDVIADLIAPGGDYLLRQLAGQAVQLGWLFTEYTERALNTKEAKASAAALSAAVKAQQACARTLACIASLTAQRQRPAPVLAHVP